MNARVMTRALIALGLLTALLVVSLAGRLSGIGAEAAAPNKDSNGTASSKSFTLGVPTAALPTVAMLDGTRNQDTCKGVTVHLAYTGSATNQ